MRRIYVYFRQSPLNNRCTLIKDPSLHVHVFVGLFRNIPFSDCRLNRFCLIRDIYRCRQSSCRCIPDSQVEDPRNAQINTINHHGICLLFASRSPPLQANYFPPPPRSILAPLSLLTKLVSVLLSHRSPAHIYSLPRTIDRPP